MSRPRISIALDAPALARGVGFFETLWVLGGRAVFFGRHYQRLAGTCRALDLPVPDVGLVRRSVARALRDAPAAPEQALRWSYLALERDLASPRSWKFFATVFPVPPESLSRRRGIRAVRLPSDWRRVTPKWKTIDYRLSVAGMNRAKKGGANEAIFVDRRGRALEGTASNIFRIRGPVLKTAPIGAGILPGVVRAWVREHAARAGLAVRDAAVPAAELREGAFFASSLTGIAPLVSLDGRRCESPGDRFRDLRGLYLDDARAGRGDLDV